MNARKAAAELAPRLLAAGIADAGFEAEYLVRIAGGFSRAEYFLGRQLGVDERERLGGLVERRLKREPAAYIHGQREFYGLIFEVSGDVLVPRPESELLVEEALKACHSLSKPVIVDVGTGSGAVAVALAKHLADQSTIVATDVSARALGVAIRNACRHGARVFFVKSDLAGSIEHADIIVANLPYIPSGEVGRLEPEVRDWEPRLALDGGADGLDLIERLIDDCATRIRPQLLVLEVGLGQAAPVEDLCAKQGAEVEIILDLSGIERVVCARWA